MSIVHNIINKKSLDFSILNTFVSTIDGTLFENRGENTFYYWIDGKSTRGFEVSLEPDLIEVRNLALSNKYDYELTNKIVEKILTLTGGIIRNEEGKKINIPIFNNDKIIKTEIRDCETILSLSKEHDIGIDGPIREVHFGKRMYKNFQSLKGEQLKNRMFDLIFTVNYRIPNFEKGNILQVGTTKEDQKIIKVVTNETDCIFGKYDYFLFYISEEKFVMITNEILNTILPSKWTLVDEYTIVAPVIDVNEWEKLLANAKKHDLWTEFNSK